MKTDQKWKKKKKNLSVFIWFASTGNFPAMEFEGKMWTAFDHLSRYRIALQMWGQQIQLQSS